MLLAPFDRTPPRVARAMLRLAGLRRGERLLDVGCGDGSIVVEAAKLGAVAVGVDLDAALVGRARMEAERLGLSERVHLVVGDYRAIKMWFFDVVTMYLTTRGNLAVFEELLCGHMGRGTIRVVTHDFAIPKLEPERVEVYRYSGFDKRTLYLYLV